MNEIKIKPSKIGSLRAIARSEKAVNEDGKISVSWMRRKLKDTKTSTAVKKKINFALNTREWN